MKTNRRLLSASLVLIGWILSASPSALAQRFGSFSDVLAPMMGGGWSMHQHAAPVPSLPPERAGDYKTLAGSLAKRLPHGTDLRSAAAGFRNLGDFVAAVHASDNLKISFADIKARMMNGGTLHAAIAELRPQADAGIEARRARSAAFEELRQS